MAKYSFEFKMKLVKEYLDGKAGYDKIAIENGLHPSILSKWIKNYQRFGIDGLVRSRQQQVYTFEFKLHVVELYLASELSYQELALQVGMTDPATIVRWVNGYRTVGP